MQWPACVDRMGQALDCRFVGQDGNRKNAPVHLAIVSG